MGKSGRPFKNSRQILTYLARIFGNTDDFTAVAAVLFLIRQLLHSKQELSGHSLGAKSGCNWVEQLYE